MNQIWDWMLAEEENVVLLLAVILVLCGWAIAQRWG